MTFESQFNSILPLVALGVGIVLFLCVGFVDSTGLRCSISVDEYSVDSCRYSDCLPVRFQLWLAIHYSVDPLRATARFRHGLQHFYPHPHT